ncbi:hypothetical protein J4438_02285 [Candidatus Woesearchaeota archaeon]|nr:hypothetical protein [Candidatus Woesearchaeota archaeon]
MAQAKQSSKSAEKRKKKKWVSIHSPKSFGSAELGESYVNTPQELIGRNIRVNLASIMKVKNSNVRIKFVAKEVKEDHVITEAESYEILSNQVNRIVKKGKTKIDDSRVLTTKDEIKCTIKTIIITRNRIKGGLSAILKNEAIKFIESEVKSKTFEKLFEEVIMYNFQKALKDHLKKISPIQIIEIKYFGK